MDEAVSEPGDAAKAPPAAAAEVPAGSSIGRVLPRDRASCSATTT